MNAILKELSAWLGYLDRQAVSWQLGFILLALIAATILHKYRKGQRVSSSLDLLFGPLLLLIPSLLLKLIAVPTGISTQFGWIWSLWNVVSWLEIKLQRRYKASRFTPWLGKVVRPTILVAAIVYFIDRLSSISSIALIQIGTILEAELAIGNVFVSLVGLYLIFVCSRTIAFVMAWLLQTILRTKTQSRKLLEQLIQYLIVAIGTLLIALQAGFNATALLWISGGLSFGLGFSLKEIMTNLLSGIWLLLEGWIQPGEVLMINGDPCRVTKLGLRATELSRSRDDATLLIPNFTFFTKDAESFTAGENDRRESIHVSAAYQHEPKAVIAVLEEVAKKHQRVLKMPSPKAFAIDFSESSIDYKLKFSVPNPLEALSIGSELRQAIWVAFDDNGIKATN
ncbi:small-conductance mechanosensitive ion channel/ MscS family [Synechococcus sp. BIOS-U3-1]|uniref:mechanosensitive ion channel family protein n=1 Tax=Synechococcus sp. BIOS-U3-1 TaxID=1400865 RepID=UPI0016473E82|nr:mechanosensitive ion channel domain-containing protein [Synechococcus sp. BIOS-U3-1]QNI60201.1 small-conductance mechanosensitive ion channel/ MscS family [Synechococcus sp. BIOS-U3-1]|tara:strand:- start:480 stop:1670 length:1191 start_codon:yes stop_codon:yes gene_type:complete